MRYRILGKIEARVGDRAVDLGGPRQRRVLAALLLSPNQPVPVPRLVEATWDDTPPATADRQVRNRVAALRATLTRHGGFIDTADGGYLLRVDAGALDLQEFDDLVRQGRETGDPAVLRRALALWRGPALADVDGTVAARHAAILEERRLAALDDRLRLELAAGRHADLTPELRDLVEIHPLHEGFAALLVVALHRAGRSAEATAIYDDVARRLADDLGVDPGAALRRSLAELTAGETTAPVRPAQIPTDVAGFTGRLDHLAALDDLAAEPSGRTLLTSAIVGSAGVGKTALAVHWAHRARAAFPDGQLYINLRGYDRTPPVRPLEALGALLRGLGLPADQVPSTMEEAAARYRSLLAGRRVLIVLDNAADADRVRPLLPDSPGSLALITSRDALDGLDSGTRRITLDVLPPDEAHALLTRLIGADRVAAEPAATRDLARLCAYLPLALRIAAANLDDTATINEHTRRLTAGNRLGALQIDGDERAAVRGAFDLSYAALPAPGRRMFRLLGLPAAPDISVSAAASLLGVPPAQAATLLDQLAAAHLIDRSAAGRYTFHDLLRAYAAELAEVDDSEVDRREALRRILDHYLHSGRVADVALTPQGNNPDLPLPVAGVTVESQTDHAGALAWFMTEYPAIVAMVGQAVRSGFDEHTWRLARIVSTFLGRQGLRHDRFKVWQDALAAVGRDGDLRTRAEVHRSVAVAHGELGLHDEAQYHMCQSLELFRQIDDGPGQALTHHGLAWLLHLRNRPLEALDHVRQCLPLYQSLGDRRGEATTLNALGWFLSELGELTDAVSYCQQALALHRGLGNVLGEAETLDSIGLIQHRLGRFSSAVSSYRAALAKWEEAGDRYRGDTFCRMGDSHASAGEFDDARACWEKALALFLERDDPDARSARAKLDGLAMITADSGSRSNTNPP